MKRLGLKKITPMCLPLARGEFKRGVVLIISAIFILLVGVAMGGCAIAPAPVEYRDPLSIINIQSASTAYPNLVLAVLISENTKNAIESGRRRKVWITGGDLEKMLEKDIDIYRKNFKAVIRIDKFEDVSAINANLVTVLDWITDVQNPNNTQFDKRAIFLTLDKQPIDAIKGQGIQKVQGIDSNANVVKAIKRADAEARVQLESALRSSVKLAEFSKSKTGISSTANVKDQKEMSAHASEKSTPKSDVDEIPSVKAKPNKNSYAIVIGIENYRQKLPKADYATADANTVTEYLTKVMGYSEENVVTLTNDRAALGDFVKYFEKWLPNNAEKDSTVFVYYSGHGAPNPKSGDAYIVPYDGDPSFIEQTGYSLKRLYENLNKLQAKEIVVALDSCFSGAGGRSVIAKGARPLVMNLQNNMILSKNMTVLSASSGDQISSTYDEKGHGLFTYFMLKGIKNENVLNPDGSIKMDDLFGYLKPQVERIARKQYNNEQTPQLIGAKKN